MQDQKVAIVTGSSSGIGFETSLTLARNGFHTYATMRNMEGEKSKPLTEVAKNENLQLRAIELDVDNDKSVIDAINTIVEERERIDVLINNAGYALGGALEDSSMDEIKAQFETNFFGAVRATKEVLPVMRRQGAGKIVNITSMGGRIAIPLSSSYHGSKFALEGLSESIRYEPEPFGIKVILIEPGAVGSNFWKNIKIAKSSSDSNSPYTQFGNKILKAYEQMEQNTISPSVVAKTILDAVTSNNPQLRYLVGEDAAKTLEARKNMPDNEFGDLIKKQFGI
ncbi:MAG TPA: SDR family NAD(P)-dependent oxidoreductase [Nitrososphaeraceae archaeon]|nr:SDR family NAD(P)-dependent oxidoreductase [Nitrososphaeraceae archaeon]